MFYIGIVASIGLWIIVALLVLKLPWSQSLPFTTLLCGLGFIGSCVSFPLGVFSAAMAIQLCVFDRFRLIPIRSFVPIATGLGIATWAIFIALAVRYPLHLTNLHEEYPKESLDGRLAEPNPKYRFEKWDDAVPLYSADEIESMETRADALKNLHENSMRNFVWSPYFGVNRMSMVFTARQQKARYVDNDEPIRQPEKYDPNLPTPAYSHRDLLYSFSWMHTGTIRDFVDPRSIGYFENRNEVIGFRPHRVHELPGTTGWKTVRLELVSLLKNDPPAVYISEKLPQMNELKDAKTRELDEFETGALKQIVAGENLHWLGNDADIRLLGAVRSVDATCVKCHGGQKGDLLGAFSYRLKNEKKK